jgi:hypothetical protein
MRLLGHQLCLRMARTHRDAPEPQTPQQLADAALMQVNAERGSNLLLQVDPSPADNAVHFQVRTGPHPCGDLLLVLGAELGLRSPGVRPIAQSSHTVRVVAMHPVA